MSSTILNPIQGTSAHDYHSKISLMLLKIEQDVTALEAHFRSGPPNLPPPIQSTPSLQASPHTPKAPHLPFLLQFPALPMDNPVPPAMYTPTMPTMPLMYIPSFPLRAEAYRGVMEYQKPEAGRIEKGALGMVQGLAHDCAGGGGEGEEDEVYDPMNPIMDVGENGSRPYDFERLVRKRSEDIKIWEVETEIETLTEPEPELPEMEIDADEIDYQADQEEELPFRELKEVLQSQQNAQQQVENQGEQQQTQTIETDSPSNHTSERFWAQLFSEKNKMELGGRHKESGETGSQKYSPFGNSPAPEVSSPSVEMTRPNDGLERQWKQRDFNVTSEYWSAPVVTESGDEDVRGEEDYLIEEQEKETQEFVHPHPDGEGFWRGTPDAMDVAKDIAIRDAEDEYEYDFEYVEGQEDGEVGCEEGSEERSDEGVDYDEEDFIDSE